MFIMALFMTATIWKQPKWPQWTYVYIPDACYPRWASDKNPYTQYRDIINASLILGQGPIPWRRVSNPFQYSCLGNPVDR